MLTYKYRLYPTVQQQALMNSWLDESAFIWNQCLFAKEKHFETYKHLSAKERPKLDVVKDLLQPFIHTRAIQMPSGTRNSIAYRLDEAYKKFFKELKERKKNPGKPKYFMPNEAFESIDFPTIRHKKDESGDFKYYDIKFQDSFGHEQGRLRKQDFDTIRYVSIPQIGNVRIVLHRYFDFGSWTSARIKKETTTNEWYLCIVADKTISAAHPSDNIIGLDKGSTDILASYDGNLGSIIPNPKLHLKNEEKIKKLQRQKSRMWEMNFYRCSDCGHCVHENRRRYKKSFTGKFKCVQCGSEAHVWRRKNYNKIQTKINKLEKETTRRTEYVYHHFSKQIAENNFAIMREKLQINNLKKNKRHSSQIQKNDWGKLDYMIKYKVEMLNGLFLSCNPQYTSQTCSECNYCHKENRDGKSFKCLECGYQEDADVNAAKNMYRLGMYALTCQDCGEFDKNNILTESPETFLCTKCGHTHKITKISLDKMKLAC